MASVNEAQGRWCVRWRRDGTRRGRSFQQSFSTERLAQAFAQEVEDAIERHGFYEPRRARRSTALAMILADYIADSARRHAEGTTHNYAQHLQLFQVWAGPIDAEDLSWSLLSDYHRHLAAPETGRHLHRRGHNTIVKHFQAVEQAWEWAWKRQARGQYQGIPQPDSLDLKRRHSAHKRAPTWTQMDAAIGAAGGWQRNLYVVLRCTGLRVQQAMELRWEDFRLDQEIPILHIRPELGKSPQEKRGRWIPVAPALVTEIATWGRRDGYLLDCPRLEREARARDAQRAWRRARVDQAVWAGCAHHAFRAGFESGLKRLGADDEAVEFLVGHSLGIRGHYVDPDALPLVAAVRLVPVCATCAAPERDLSVVQGGGRDA